MSSASPRNADRHIADRNYSIRNIVFILFILRYTRKSFYSLRGYGLFGSIRNFFIAVRLFCYGIFLRAPGVRGQVDKQVSEAIGNLESKLVQSGPDVTRYLTLPKEGWSADQIRTELTKLAGLEHTRWEDGRVSGAVYHGGEELLKLQTEAFGQFGVANPIHPDVFPGVRKMEAEVVAMVCFMCSCAARHFSDEMANFCRSCLCSMLPRMALVLPPVVVLSRFSWPVWRPGKRASWSAV